MSISVCIGVVLLVALLYVIWRLHPKYGSNPGIACFPIVGVLPYFILNKHRVHHWFVEVHNKASLLTVRIPFGMKNALSTIDPCNVEHILRVHFHTYPKGPDFYPYFVDLLGSGIFNVDGPLWLFQRKVASHVFDSKSLRDFVVQVSNGEILHRLIPTLLHYSTYDTSFDLQALLMDYTFDTACQLTFGADLACLKIPSSKNSYYTSMGSTSSKSFDYLSVPHHIIQRFVFGVKEVNKIIGERFLQPKILWETKRRFCLESEKKLFNAMKGVNDFYWLVIQESKKELTFGKERNDILGRFMQLSKEEMEDFLSKENEATWDSMFDNQDDTGKKLSNSLLKDILLSFILAGRETVASGVTFFMWLLCCHPNVEEEVHREVQRILQSRKSPNDTTFSFDELKKMNYLEAALHESMRLYPPVPFDYKFATKDDKLPDGTSIGKGFRITYNIFAMGRSKRLWGEDCHEFRPERWLSKDGQFLPANPYKYPVFQAGPRICLGKEFALIQMKSLIASLICKFKFQICSRFQPTLSNGIILTMVNGLPINVSIKESLV